MKAPYVKLVRHYRRNRVFRDTWHPTNGTYGCDVEIFFQRKGHSYFQLFHILEGKPIPKIFNGEQKSLSESAIDTRFRKAKTYDIIPLTEEEMLNIFGKNFCELL